MMQWLKVLRGCLAAYLLGVFLFGAISIFNGDNLGATMFVAVFGLLVMAPFTIVALIIWSVLARRNTRVTLWQVCAICGSIFFGLAVVGAISDGDLGPGLLVSAVSPLVGAMFGVAFWLGAFGFRYSVSLTAGQDRGA